MKRDDRVKALSGLARCNVSADGLLVEKLPQTKHSRKGTLVEKGFASGGERV